MRFVGRALSGVFLLGVTLALIAWAGVAVRDAVDERLNRESSDRPARERVFAVNVMTAGLWSVSAIGLLVPGAQLLTGPLLVGVAIVFLPLDYAGFALDRRGVRFADRRRWLRAHLATMLGFGSAAFVACLVPVVVVISLITHERIRTTTPKAKEARRLAERGNGRIQVLDNSGRQVATFGDDHLRVVDEDASSLNTHRNVTTLQRGC